jgi:hypothetical protein
MREADEKAFTFIPVIARYSAMAETRKWFEQFCADCQDFIVTNGIKGNPQDVRTGGLEAIPASLNDLRVSLVVHNSENVLIDRQRRFQVPN